MTLFGWRVLEHWGGWEESFGVSLKSQSLIQGKQFFGEEFFCPRVRGKAAGVESVDNVDFVVFGC